MRTFRLFFLSVLTLAISVPAIAGDIRGRITDRTGAVVQSATVRLMNIASGDEVSATADAQGRYQFAKVDAGVYRLVVTQRGFSEQSRTVVVQNGSADLTADFALEIGSMKADVTVTAARGARDTRDVPLRTDTIGREVLDQIAPVSVGDALATLPGIEPVGSGPFQMRPRLRGLDSTRVLVLVDGQRLNNSRTATDRAGIEVGLVDPDSVEAIEVLGGAGSVLYGTDALSGTINIITNRPRISPARQFTMGFNGFYSSNENGRRGTVSLGASDKRWAVRFIGGAEQYGDYKAGKNFQETTLPFFADKTIVQADTADVFGFNFHAFPDPFNAPFTRTSAEIPESSMHGTSMNVAATALLSASQDLQLRYQRRHADNVGFPDFQPPYFFQTISLPFSDLDKFSASYTARRVASWLPRLSIAGYFQRQDRLLRNDFPVQFPAPSPGFFPINIFRLQILSDTRQQVWTPGLDVQANLLTRPNHVVTAGVSMFRDRSEDARTTTTTTTMIGNVALGQFGPAANVFPSPVVLGPPSITNPVRVPNATFLDTGLYLHDEWDVTPVLKLTGGIRGDFYNVTTNPTPGYDVASLLVGAVPAIDLSTLPNVNGDRIRRSALTGEAGMLLWSARPVSVFAHYVRSYRHPNLEELLFAGPATAGSIVPNVKVQPETGHNVDVGARVVHRHVSGSAAYFNNTYHQFISTEVIAAVPSANPPGSISQAINLASVRIQGIEGHVDAPFVIGNLMLSPYASLAFTRGTVLSGTSPLSGVSLADQPQDNITPWKVSAGVRAADRRNRFWTSYSARTTTDVTRVSPLLSNSPFLIAQDLLSLSGFTVHRIAGGYNWAGGGDRLGLTLAVDNLTDRFYREQFQFAPARGRSFSVLVNVGGGR